ncbi:DUF4185 domain-containing protein [Dietzia sp. DQ11-44]|uniref:DUF4185 domain-containing protein n=1 Tax=Dietzia TaxID=37914 RepID=UPI0015CB67BD|nr:MULTISPECIES: DUF4185 domain-containing protein [unclassified Dietzia]MBB1041935.1 DUF4185 domain-containing protein [Dietzia sp. Cai40]MBB1045841.1 DUF4185 domain-containing protein [Dietzia sp. DQ11-44]MBC7296098.1 DUF4185 domain-containing protein [Dietzia sp.]MBB1049696.1 DUF4185 domain-containing protein [Dietzia sp. CW19]MBB1056124.1 DUF4185 domain-containing protein [Dietzia sp. B19]
MLSRLENPVAWTLNRRRTHRPRLRTGPFATATAATLAAGALTVLSPVAAAAPCDPWPPAGGGSGSGSGSLGTPAATPATPWATGDSGYIPVLQGRTTTVELLTGPTSPNKTVERFGISGTDLGILWENGDASSPQVLMALGDTMGDCSLPGDQWRSNILFRSSDRTLSDGMRIDDAPMEGPGLAKSILPRSGLPGEVTVIPTAGVQVDGTQYLRYMSVASWGAPGEWITNYSALAASEDNGENWTPVSGTARTGTGSAQLIPPSLGAPHTTHTAGQMSAFLEHDGYVYEYLTPSGRSGAATLARVPAGSIEDMSAYEFWNGTGWVADHRATAPVIPARVSELSVSWSPRLGRFIALYTNANNDIVMRQAATPEGPWSGEDILLSYAHVPTLYGAFIHPWSPAVETVGSDLYFTMSTWDAYNVFLMKTDLNRIPARTLPDPNARMRTADDSWTRDTPDPAETGETVLVERLPIPGA